MMKIFFKHPAVLFFLLLATVFSGCKDTIDSETPYGISNIYIPQSKVSGGSSLNYFVPTGFDVNTYNYKEDVANNKVNVLLGVSRAGNASPEAYSVDITTQTDTINTLITAGTIKLDSKTVVLLPSNAYTLPTNVSVPAGQYSASFNLSIDKTILKTYAGKKVALCVVISNPSKYTLSTSNSKVIVIIDYDNLKLSPATL